MKIGVAFTMALFFALGNVAVADEGMWTFDHFPSKAVGTKYGFAPSQAWLDHIRSSALRIAGGCSASFISPHGLVMTNHHCAVDCEDALSTAQNNLVQSGFYAKTQADETKCPGFEIDQLTSITNVTKEMLAATKGLSGAAITTASRAENAKLQKACATDSSIRCDVVSLYHGGVYDVYKYNRFRDVRLVFAPEFAVAQFGGDPDNFNFPRFDFDIALLRVYGNGKPSDTPDYLRWSKNGSQPGDPVFVAGNPGSTQRELTVAQLEYLRDVALPKELASLSELRGLLEQYQTLGVEQQRTTNDELFFVENDYKVVVGQLQALDDPALFATLESKEHTLRARVARQRALQVQYGDAWTKLAALQTLRERLGTAEAYKSGGIFDQSTAYFGIAQTLVRLPVEKAKPNAQRLPEFSDSALVTLPEELFDPRPIYPAVEQLNLAFALDTLRREFGPDDPFVRDVLQGRSPADAAQYLVANTKLGDVSVRKKLYDGGEPAVQASDDAFIQLASRIDAQARGVQKQYEDAVTNPSRQFSESIAKARFAIDGTSVYPDATFTLRLSYGAVAGFSDSHGVIPPFTTIGGLFNHASNADPYVLPQSWLAAKSSLDPQTPMNLSTTNDIIGGNSGSPLMDKNGDVVGLIFDGNIHSLGGAFGYDPRLNRSVALDSRAIIAGLTHVYHADRIVTEILGSP
ncbi:MAG TPA: S46 family peptidase [Verrucomicrobiae bacterium]|nr:S46 family peptidase [Verrucomicrobiae bacterium]